MGEGGKEGGDGGEGGIKRVPERGTHVEGVDGVLVEAPALDPGEVLNQRQQHHHHGQAAPQALEAHDLER